MSTIFYLLAGAAGAAPWGAAGAVAGACAGAGCAGLAAGFAGADFEPVGDDAGVYCWTT